MARRSSGWRRLRTSNTGADTPVSPIRRHSRPSRRANVPNARPQGSAGRAISHSPCRNVIRVTPPHRRVMVGLRSRDGPSCRGKRRSVTEMRRCREFSQIQAFTMRVSSTTAMSGRWRSPLRRLSWFGCWRLAWFPCRVEVHAQSSHLTDGCARAISTMTK